MPDRTLGHKHGPNPTELLSWAKATGNLRTLSILIETAAVSQTTQLGICLHFLAKPSISNLLAAWAESDNNAAELNLLATDLRSAPDILRAHPTVPSSKRLVDQFRGTVEHHQVLLMLAVRRLGQDPEIQNWFDTLRLWILIHAVHLTRNAPVQDDLISLLAEKLRLAADGDENWLTLVAKIKGGNNSVESVSKHLKWITNRIKPDEKGAHLRFLATLDRVAQGDSKASTRKVTAEVSRLFTTEEHAQPNLQPIPITDWNWQTLAVDEDTPARVIPEIPASVALVPEKASASQRSLTGRGIQLRSAEQLQFLPWSWHNANPVERQRLESLITELRQSSHPKKKILGWLIRVAILTSRSMRQVVGIRVTDSPGQDWSVTRDFQELHRLPPRRSARWQAGPEQEVWIRPLQDSLSLQLSLGPPNELEIPPDSQTLDEIWRVVSPDETAETAFNSLCSADHKLHRLTSGMIAGIFASQIYESSDDAVLAQLLASGPQTGLGGNSAYASWTGARATSVMQQATGIAPPNSPDGGKNAAGSELDPLDEALRATIQNCESQIQDLAKNPDQWIEHHNALVFYIVNAMFAATGGRPVNDPFESPALIDWQALRVFLSDKMSKGRSGRLVPLPKGVFKLVADTYCQHLKILAHHLEGVAAPLAQQIAILADRRESTKLPFFFLLREEPCLSWESVTERALGRQPYLNWPLPANLMRHRLSVRLRGAGIDPEIIDAILGHADQGVMSHGEESARIWAEDMAATIPKLEFIYQQLGFADKLALQRAAPSRWPLIETDQLFAISRPFGSKARAEARKNSRHQARRMAKKAIKKVIGERPLESIEPETWEELAIEMLTVDGKRPHPHGALRYEVLVRWQTHAGNRSKLRLKRIFVLDRGFESVFTSTSIGCERLINNLEAWFRHISEALPLSKTSVRNCIALAALDLVITCRITAPRVLSDVRRKSNIRIVVQDGHAYLEHHPLLGLHPDAPATRYRIPIRCAQWLDKALDSKSAMDLEKWPVPENWSALLPAITGKAPSTAAELIHQIAKVVHQANYLTRPGLIAGYLAGALPTSALPHPAWILDTQGMVAEPAPETNESDTSDDSPEPHDGAVKLPTALNSFKHNTRISSEDTRQSASNFIKTIRQLLSDYRGDAGTETASQKTGTDTIAGRRDLANALTAHVTAHTATVSSAIWGLGVWAVYLVSQPRKKNTSYAISSVLRYVSALAQRFIEVGSEFDLVGADTDEVTDFYDEVLEMNRDLDLQYVVERLVSFHRFMQMRYKIDDADWSELDCGTEVPHGSPGTLGLRQYENALNLFATDPANSTDAQLACAFMLLLTFRFGLRGNDAIGLQLRDFWRHEEMIVIHVQKNVLRRLKRPASRRVVPLVEKLTGYEWSIIEQFMTLVAALADGNSSFPLFGKNILAERFDLNGMRRQINQALANVCSDPTVTHYKARHAFANRVAEPLIGHLVRKRSAIGESVNTNLSDHIPKLLLGKVGPTRRASWALSRLLGHARPRTSFKSYVHLLPVWSDSWPRDVIDGIDGNTTTQPLHHAVMLDDLSVHPWQPLEIDQAPKQDPVAITPLVIINYFELLRRGAPQATAKRSSGMAYDFCDFIDAALSAATDKLQNRTARMGRKPMGSLLNQLSQLEWRRIAHCCAEYPGRPTDFNHEGQSIQLAECMEMLSKNRQLLMWKKRHFQRMADFTKVFHLTDADLRVLQTPALHAKVRLWLDQWIPINMLAASPPGARVDSAEEDDEEDEPPRSIKDRCAAVVNPSGGGVISTGYGLAVLWLVFVCAGFRASSIGCDE